MKHALEVIDHAIGAADTFGLGIAKNLIAHRAGREDEDIIQDLSAKNLLDLLQHTIEKLERKEYELTQLSERAKDLTVVVDLYVKDPYNRPETQRESLEFYSKLLSGTVEDIERGVL